MNLKALFYICKTLLISIFFLLSSTATAADDAVTTRLLFAEDETVVQKYRALSKEEQKQWATELQQNLSDATLPQLLVISAHYYETGQYKLAKKSIDQLLKQAVDSTPLVITANAWFLNSMNTAIGLDQFDGSVAVFEKTVATLNRVSDIEEQQQLLELAIVAKYRLGSLLLFLKKTERAKSYIQEAIALAHKAPDRRYLITPILELAKYYIATDDQEQAEQQLIESYDIALATKSSRRADILHQLSRYYRKNKRYDLAIEYATRSLKYREEYLDRFTYLPEAYNNLAIAYEESGDLNSALVHYLNSIKILEGKTGYHYLALATHNTGLIYQKQKKFKLALDYLLDANKHFLAMGHNYFLMSNHLSLAEVYFSQNDFSNTIKYGELALAAATKHNQRAVEFDALRYLSKSYLETKAFEKSAAYYQRYSVYQNDDKEKLEKKLAQKNSSAVTDNAALKANLYEVKSELNAEKLITAQQARSISNRTQLLYLMVAIAITCFAIYLRTKRLSKRWKAQINLDKATQVTYLHNEQILLSTINKEFIGHSNIFALKLPLLTQLPDVMDIEQAQAFKIHLMEQLSSFIERPLYKISEDTFVFAKTPPAAQSVGQRFDVLISYYLTLIPQELNELASQHSIMLGGISRKPADKAVNLIQAKNMINLSLTALSAVKQYQTWEAKNNWLMLTEKENSSTTMFTCPSRKEWLQLINNHMLTVESGLDQDIDWLNVPHYDQ